MENGDFSKMFFIDSDGKNVPLTEDMILNFDASEDEFETDDLDELNFETDEPQVNHFDNVFNRILNSAEDPEPEPIPVNDMNFVCTSESPSHVIISNETDDDPNQDKNKKPQTESEDPKSVKNKKRQTQAEIYKNIVWKQKNLDISDEQIKFSGNSDLPDNILNLDTPYQFFPTFLLVI